eukprot:scaffold33544_cov105-Isochrysis_galbana.AAC.2
MLAEQRHLGGVGRHHPNVGRPQLVGAQHAPQQRRDEQRLARVALRLAHALFGRGGDDQGGRAVGTRPRHAAGHRPCRVGRAGAQLAAVEPVRSELGQRAVHPRESDNPRRAASSLTTVGRSCLWSPTSTSCRHPRVSGTRHEGSVDWAVSSISTISKTSLDSASPPEPTQVARTTSAEAMAPLPPSASGIRHCMSGRTASGRPSLTTFSPAATSPAPMLSTATLESAEANTGRRPSARTHRLRI